jgi:hypothetical protein
MNFTVDPRLLSEEANSFPFEGNCSVEFRTVKNAPMASNVPPGFEMMTLELTILRFFTETATSKLIGSVGSGVIPSSSQKPIAPTESKSPVFFFSF